MAEQSEKTRYPCPCGSKVEWTRKEIITEGVNCGTLDVEICPKCKSEYFPEKTMAIIEKKLSENGLWGVERKEISFWKTGNAIVFRIPNKIAGKLGITSKHKAHIYPEGTHKIILEI